MGSMFQIGGRAIDIDGEIPYCVNGNWNGQKCDCFPGFVESTDNDEGVGFSILIFEFLFTMVLKFE